MPTAGTRYCTHLTATLLWGMQQLTLIKTYHRLGMFWYVLLLLLRFFRGFPGRPQVVPGSTSVLLGNPPQSEDRRPCLA